MYPPGPGVDRETTEDIEYNGYKLPKGTVIGVSCFLVHIVSVNNICYFITCRIKFSYKLLYTVPYVDEKT